MLLGRLRPRLQPHARPSLRERRRETGSAAIEFALVMPLLLMLVVGIVSYGYLLSFRQAMSQGASEGARAAAVSALPAQDQKVAQAVAGVNDALGAYGVSCQLTPGVATGSLLRSGAMVGTCGVATAPCVNHSQSSCVSVRVTYDYADHPLVPEIPGIGVVMPDSLSYTAVAQVS